MQPIVEIDVTFTGWDDHPGIEARIEQAIIAAAKTVKGRPGPTEISIALSNDADVRALNARWRAIDKPTNVLSFPAAVGPGNGGLLGDIILAYETVAAEASEGDKAFADHVAHLSIHGFLHLIGHDHENDDEAEVMENLERQVLTSLGISDPYSEPLAQRAS